MVNIGIALIVGVIIDRFGRKWVLVVSLFGNGIIYRLLGHANTLVQFAILMVFWGQLSPLYRFGGDTMVADLVEPIKRSDAYALL